MIIDLEQRSIVVLGYAPEGLVGAIRASFIVKPKGKKRHRKDQYGAFLW
jgi:predicted ATP-grasp superfamily ATP-dependent carboligase